MIESLNDMIFPCLSCQLCVMLVSWNWFDCSKFSSFDLSSSGCCPCLAIFFKKHAIANWAAKLEWPRDKQTTPPTSKTPFPNNFILLFSLHDDLNLDLPWCTTLCSFCGGGSAAMFTSNPTGNCSSRKKKTIKVNRQPYNDVRLQL